MLKKVDMEKRTQTINRDWEFSYGLYHPMAAAYGAVQSKTVHLPHDYMIEEEVSADAPAGTTNGFYNGRVGSYTKNLVIPNEWENDKVYLHFDGVMMNASIEVNGSLVVQQHYGYTPFDADITQHIYWGENNRITVTVNPTMQPNSRWYTGAGIYRHVSLVHKPQLHIGTDGIYAYIKRLEWQGECVAAAFVETEVTVENDTLLNHMAHVEVAFCPENSEEEPIVRSTVIYVEKQKTAKARISCTIREPLLWDTENPQLYKVTAKVTDAGVFGVRSVPCKENPSTDEEETSFGIRTITADSTYGLRINGKVVKLKGGCIHHDNGILGAISLKDAEERKLRKMKELGYNAVRMAHNPPSKELLKACDRLGIYVFNEAFDAWQMAKQPGDYSQFFASDWKQDLKNFILRDRNHPSVIFWSTGNEIVERGGLGNGYAIATELADFIRTFDTTRLVTNGLCSYWSGLDDKSTDEFIAQIAKMMAGQNDMVLQNATTGSADTSWEERSEAFSNALDVVGYNYLDDHYELDGKMYPERVIIGTESYPGKMQEVWELVEKLPYVIGDFSWTSIDYIGEAGIGKSMFVDKDDPILKQGAMAMQSSGSAFPWRLANDADLDINGNLTPQGAMRKLIWGSKETFLFVQNPENFDKAEIVSPWGWPDIASSWNWNGSEGKSVKVIVYSGAPETELLLNGRSLGKQETGKVSRYQTAYEIIYEPGMLRAVSSDGGNEISNAQLVTTNVSKEIAIQAECTELSADGESLAYIAIEIVDEDGLRVPDAEITVTVSVEGCGTLAGSGSAAPETTDNYTSGYFTTYQGRGMAVIRSGVETGTVVLQLSAEGMKETSVTLQVM